VEVFLYWSVKDYALAKAFEYGKYFATVFFPFFETNLVSIRLIATRIGKLSSCCKIICYSDGSTR